MKVTCRKENLKEALDHAERMTSRNATLPILNHFLLATDKGQLKVSATDLEVGFSAHIQGKISNDGSLAVPAKLLTQFVNNLPDKNIDLEIKNFSLHLNCEAVRAVIRGLNPDDFPIIPKIKSAQALVINSRILKEALSDVINACAASDARPEIAGIYVRMGPDCIKFVATDSFRLAEKTVFKTDIKKNHGDSNIIIPVRTVSEVLRVIGDKDRDISIFIDPNQILYDFGESKLVSRLVDGQYPDYEAVVPKDYETRVSVSRDVLEEAVRLASCFTGRLSDVVFKTNSKNGELEVFSNDADLGEHQTKIKADIKGKDIQAVFNWRYILDGLKNIKSEETFIEFNGGERPAVIRPSGKSDYFYIVMPIKNK